MQHASTAEVNDALEDFIPTVKTLKETKKVQISIPSLSDFVDLDDEPQRKKIKKSQKGSGLLGRSCCKSVKKSTFKTIIFETIITKGLST